jgi:hypothetical protein
MERAQALEDGARSFERDRLTDDVGSRELGLDLGDDA